VNFVKVLYYHIVLEKLVVRFGYRFEITELCNFSVNALQILLAEFPLTTLLYSDLWTPDFSAGAIECPAICPRLLSWVTANALGRFWP